MEAIEMLQTFNECYGKIQAIAQNPKWLELSNRNDVDSEMKTHLGDVLHYLEGRWSALSRLLR
ncbi:hypothetical protein [Dendronalium sp. ChiSLP03b]|uniref:hypothetical protein n=1 Tax=Dendronalium sp. ChiSLP03b TaxID=3075381 RepID=UPI00391C43E0